METDRLRYFCAIVDSGGLTKASEFLGVSHSGLSKAIAVLQEELGYKVFIPKGRGLELTERGKTLYEQSRKVLEMVNALKADKVSPQEKLLRIGFPEVLALAASESIASEFKNGVAIEDFDSGEIEVRVLEGKCDFAFTFVPFPHKDLEHLKVATVTISSFCRIGAFRSQDPERIPYVVPSSELKDNPLSIKIRDGWNSNLSRLTPYRANSLSIALKMVQAGVCAVYTPQFVVACLNSSASKSNHLVELDLSPFRRSQEKTTRDIFLVKRQSDEESKAMKTAVKVIRQVCRSQ